MEHPRQTHCADAGHPVRPGTPLLVLSAPGTRTAHNERTASQNTDRRPPILDNNFSDICTFEVLYKAYLAARRGKRSRAATAHYEVHLLENIVNLVYILTTKTYRPRCFPGVLCL